MTIVTSLTLGDHAPMDKVDYEAKLASEVQKLREYGEQLRKEYEQTAKEAEDGEPLEDAALVATRIEQKLLKAADDAVDTMINVLKYGDKDAVRISVAKYIVDHARQSPTSAGDPMDELLRRLTADVAD